MGAHLGSCSCQGAAGLLNPESWYGAASRIHPCTCLPPCLPASLPACPLRATHTGSTTRPRWRFGATTRQSWSRAATFTRPCECQSLWQQHAAHLCCSLHTQSQAPALQVHSGSTHSNQLILSNTHTHGPPFARAALLDTHSDQLRSEGKDHLVGQVCMLLWRSCRLTCPSCPAVSDRAQAAALTMSWLRLLSSGCCCADATGHGGGVGLPL
jgi:hypothetical protein